MDAFVEQSVVLLLLAWTGGFCCAPLVVGAVSRHRRQEWATGVTRRPAALAARFASLLLRAAVEPVDHGQPLPAPLLAAAPQFELTAPPRTRRRLRTRR